MRDGGREGDEGWREGGGRDREGGREGDGGNPPSPIDSL